MFLIHVWVEYLILSNKIVVLQIRKQNLQYKTKKYDGVVPSPISYAVHADRRVNFHVTCRRITGLACTA